METQTLKFTQREWSDWRQAIATALNLMRQRSADLTVAKFNPESAPDVLLADLPATKELHEKETKALEQLAEKLGVL